MSASPYPLESPEFKLLVSCVIGEIDKSRLRGIEWTLFKEIALRQKLFPIVCNALLPFAAHIPEESWLDIKAHHTSNAVNTLRQQACILQLEALLLAEKIEFVVIKGVTLSYLYKYPADRHAGDLDILICDETMLWTAVDLMVTAGIGNYEKEGLASIDSVKKQNYSERVKDVVLINRETGLIVEVHTRLFPRDSFWPSLSRNVLSYTSTCRVNGRLIRCLDDNIQLAYLFIHGSYGAWFRLKWLVDIYYRLRHCSIDELQSIAELCDSYQARRPFLQTIYLLHRLFGFYPGVKLWKKVEEERYGKFLSDFSINAIEARIPLVLISQSYFESVRFSCDLLKYRWLLRSGIQYKLSVLLERLNSVNEWEFVNFPPKLAFLYYPLMPFTLVWRVLRRLK